MTKRVSEIEAVKDGGEAYTLREDLKTSRTPSRTVSLDAARVIAKYIARPWEASRLYMVIR
jgi:hypothetical protein